MTGKRLFCFILSGLFLIYGSIPVFASGLSSSASIAITARVEQPVGFQNVSSPEMDQKLLRAPASSELQIQMGQNDSVDIFNCNGSELTMDDLSEFILDAYSASQIKSVEKASESIVLTIIIVSQ